MSSKEILQSLLNGKILKIFGEGKLERFSPAYFKIDQKLNILTYSKEINLSENFEKRKDLNIDKLLKHFETLKKEGFTFQFFDIVLL